MNPKTRSLIAIGIILLSMVGLVIVLVKDNRGVSYRPPGVLPVSSFHPP